ncbi:hypothetical protein Pmar_PMAR022316, partial [Perkinsus marinus ATCC 50983]
MSVTTAVAPVGSLLVPFLFGYAAQSGMRYGKEIYNSDVVSEMGKAAEEMERLKLLALNGLENAGLAEAAQKTYVKFWAPVRDSFLLPAGVGGTAFWLGSRSGQVAAYLSTITSKMPITGRYNTIGLAGYSIIFGSGAL